MTLRRTWKTIGTATYRAQGHPSGDGGEGDSAGGPIPSHDGRNAWPTLVIEAGDSKSLRELHNNMDWWFNTSNHDVKIVILTKFNHSHSEILLEKWEETLQPVAGATTTRAATAIGHMLTPILRQSITITRNAATNPPSYNVAGGALVLSFRLLFLRDSDPTEGDIVYSVPDLQFYAERVWAQA